MLILKWVSRLVLLLLLFRHAAKISIAPGYFTKLVTRLHLPHLIVGGCKGVKPMLLSSHWKQRVQLVPKQ